MLGNSPPIIISLVPPYQLAENATRQEPDLSQDKNLNQT